MSTPSPSVLDLGLTANVENGRGVNCCFGRVGTALIYPLLYPLPVTPAALSLAGSADDLDDDELFSSETSMLVRGAPTVVKPCP